MVNIITSPTRPTLPLKETNEVFPVSRVFGIGRNYSETPENETKDKVLTVLFMKDAYQLSLADDGIVYPKNTTQLRYEIELVVAIGKAGKNISPKDAEQYIYGYAVGVDFTQYDAQEIAKQHGWPWDKGKSFEGCAPCSAIKSKEAVKLDNNLVWLKKNDVEVQSGTLNQMIWTIPEIVSLISSEFGLLPGDLIFTGTPKGIGMVSKGDWLEGGVDGVESIRFQVK